MINFVQKSLRYPLIVYLKGRYILRVQRRPDAFIPFDDWYMYYYLGDLHILYQIYGERGRLWSSGEQTCL